VKTLKIGIASYENMKARTMAIARGELKPNPGDPKVWFTSTESFAKVLSNKNRALLATIAATRPDSLQELAGRTGRKGIQSVPHAEDDGALWIRAASSGRARTGPAGSTIWVDLSRSAVQGRRLKTGAQPRLAAKIGCSTKRAAPPSVIS
jgi:hypothetical protein